MTFAYSSALLFADFAVDQQAALSTLSEAHQVLCAILFVLLPLPISPLIRLADWGEAGELEI